MKRVIAILWAVVVANAWAMSEIVDGVTWYYETFSDGGNTCARIISGSVKYAGDLKMPSSLRGYPVTAINSSAFSGCGGLKSVTIPTSVTSIGGGAFSGCSGLTHVTLPFVGSRRGNSGMRDSLFGYVFGETSCDGTVAVNQRSSNALLGGSTFYIPMLLQTVEITDETIIGYGAFSECSGLTSVTMPEGVTSIGERAFHGCSGLTSVTIPSSVTSIGSSAFYGCSGLMSVTMPEGVISIGDSAFSGCSGLMSVTIPSSVTSIGSGAFAGCSGLTSVIIPEGVMSIGNDAFSSCGGLTSVTIPSSVTSIGSYAFYNCSGLRSVVFLGAPPSGLSNSSLLSYGRASYPREYGKDWLKFRGINSFTGYGQGEKPVVEVVSAAIREDDPTVMDVVYKVKSVKPTVKVRALAFQDGERSFAKVVRPTEFIEDTAKNVGDAIIANEAHKISWRVSADWKVDLAKVKFEVLAVEDDLLPLELTTIPKTANHAAMEISWNAMTEQQVFDALLWLYADGDAGLSLTDGVLKCGTSILVNGTRFFDDTGRIIVIGSHSNTASDAVAYVYSQMGFSVLSGDELKYANEMARLGLSPSGVRQYAWRTVEE